MGEGANILAELARAQALFQLRAIATVIGAPPSIIDTGDEQAWADLALFPPFSEQPTEYRPDPLRVDPAPVHSTPNTPEVDHDNA